MNWRNLKDSKCPYQLCDGDLADVGGIMRCNKCKFVIDVARFRSIQAHRGDDARPSVRLKWQHLLTDACPIDEEPLKQNTDKHGFRHCGKQACDFKIRQGTLDQILADPDHPANRFAKRP